MIGLANVPEERVAAYLFDQIYGFPAATVRRVQAVLPLVDGLAVPTPWGSTAAASRIDDDKVTVYSLNHYVSHTVGDGPTPPWAEHPLAAGPAPGTRLVVSRELPTALGLFTDEETTQATYLALTGRPTPIGAPPSGALAGHRFVIIAAEKSSAPRPAMDATVDPARFRALDPAALARLLTEAHTPGDPVMDLTLDAALEAGALGGRTLGACVVVLAPTSAVPRIRTTTKARLTPHTGRSPRLLTVPPP